MWCEFIRTFNYYLVAPEDHPIKHPVFSVDDLMTNLKSLNRALKYSGQ